MAMQQEPIDWRYPPDVREFRSIPTKYGLKNGTVPYQILEFPLNSRMVDFMENHAVALGPICIEKRH